MSDPIATSVTVQFDTRIPAVFIYLRDPKGFRAHKTRQSGPGVVVDFDERDEPIGIELLGPQDLEAVLKRILPEGHAEILEQLAAKSRILEEILSSAVA